MTNRSLLAINLLSPLLFYQNPVNMQQPQSQMGCETNGCRGCNNNLTNNDPASQYQRQKLIQNTVRVQSSLYTMNLAGLSSYQKPLQVSQMVDQSGTPYIAPPNVYWNQMSDRARPANQKTKVASGATYHSSSTRHSITRDRPGAMSPGGIGVDIKHNSYDRYINKLKGKSTLRRGVVPPTYGLPIPFNRSNPIYGGKTVKTSIINGCNCPDNIEGDKRIYGSVLNGLQDKILSVTYAYNIGDFVRAKKYNTDPLLYKAEIMDISNNMYTIKFEDDVIITVPYCELHIYFECNCAPVISDDNAHCNLLNLLGYE